MMHQMILAAAMVVGIVVGPVSAWPISSLDDFRVDEEVVLHCGNHYSYRIDEQSVTFNFHDSYDGKLPPDCEIHIRIEEQDVDVESVGLHVEGTMDLHDDANILHGINRCKSSYLSIADEDDTDDEMGHLDKYCSNNTFSFKTTEDITILELKVGKDGADGTGFSIKVSPHHLCGGRVHSTQVITTPDFPEPYPRNMECFWYIMGEQISIEFLEFDLMPRSQRKCKKDKVIIRSNGTSSYCGEELNGLPGLPLILSFDKYVFLEFRSEAKENSFKGFKAQVTINNSEKPKSDLLSKFYKKKNKSG